MATACSGQTVHSATSGNPKTSSNQPETASRKVELVPVPEESPTRDDDSTTAGSRSTESTLEFQPLKDGQQPSIVTVTDELVSRLVRENKHLAQRVDNIDMKLSKIMCTPGADIPGKLSHRIDELESGFSSAINELMSFRQNLDSQRKETMQRQDNRIEELESGFSSTISELLNFRHHLDSQRKEAMQRQDVELKKLADAMQGLTSGLNSCHTVLEKSFGASQMSSFKGTSPEPTVTTTQPNNKSSSFLGVVDSARNRYVAQGGDPRIPSRVSLSARNSPDIRTNISQTLLRGASTPHTPPPSAAVRTASPVRNMDGQGSSQYKAQEIDVTSPARSMDGQGSSQFKAQQIDMMIAESEATLRKIKMVVEPPQFPSNDITTGGEKITKPTANSRQYPGATLQLRPLTQNHLTHEIDYMHIGAKTSRIAGSQGLVPSTQELGHGQPRRVLAKSVSTPSTRM